MGVRGMSRLEDDVVYSPERKSFWKRLSTSGFLERLDIFSIRIAHRFLRRLHVSLLRFDNTLTAWLKKTRLKNGEEAIETEFKEMTGRLSQAPRRGDLLSDTQEANSL